jgi:hypothetical protein
MTLLQPTSGKLCVSAVLLGILAGVIGIAAGLRFYGGRLSDLA